MLMRVVLFAMLALGLGTAGVLGWSLLSVPAAPVEAAALAPPAAKATLLAAAHSLRAGSLIKPEDLLAQDVALADLPAGATRDTPQGRSQMVGALVRRSLGEGQAILHADVVHPGDHGFLAAVLGPEMRAITVAVDAVSGTAGLIWPGDRVDLILTQAMDDPTRGAGRRVAAETVLTNARVIAVDQQIVQGQAPDGTTPAANRTATLEVTAPQAERVLVAGRLGTLSLSVLSADRGAAERNAMAAGALPTSYQAPRPASVGTGVTWAGDVSPALGNAPARNAPVKVQVFQGGAEGKEFNF